MSAADNAYFFESSDELTLCYRDFGDDRSGAPRLCLRGLRRNSREFDDLANYTRDRRRVITPDLEVIQVANRGRVQFLDKLECPSATDEFLNRVQ